MNVFAHFFFRTELGCLSRKEIIESVNQSLRNLGLEYIDLLIIHKNDPNCPLEGNVKLNDSSNTFLSI